MEESSRMKKTAHTSIEKCKVKGSRSLLSHVRAQRITPNQQHIIHSSSCSYAHKHLGLKETGRERVNEGGSSN